AGAGAALFPGAGGTWTAAGSAGRARATGAAGALAADASTGFAGNVALSNIGAGCEPDCINNTLIRTATTATAPTRNPMAARGLQPSRRNRLRAPSLAPSSAFLPRAERAP